MASAEDRPPASDLPGVSQPAPIVQPLPEPVEQSQTYGNGFVRMGDWDVKISGYTRIDVSAGTLPPDKR